MSCPSYQSPKVLECLQVPCVSCSLMHLTATKCILTFPVIVFYLYLISFLLIIVLILRGVSTLPRLAVCLCFAKSLTLLFPYASFFLLSSHHSCFPLKSHLLLNIPYNSMAQNESIVQTGQQHCSSQQGIVFKTKIINAVAVVCSARETHHGAVLDRVLCEN